MIISAIATAMFEKKTAKKNHSVKVCQISGRGVDVTWSIIITALMACSLEIHTLIDEQLVVLCTPSIIPLKS